MNKKIAILNFAGCPNYGANLTAYAIAEYCKNRGTTPALIDRRFLYTLDLTSFNSPFSRFCQKRLRWTPHCFGRHTFRTTSADYDTFIVGSDQVWTYKPNWDTRHIQDREIFDFSELPDGKKRIAVAASFGSADHSNVPKEFVEARSAALKKFTAISVREASGVDICRDYYGVRAVHVLDPVFLLTGEEWGKLADEGRKALPDEFATFCTLHQPYVPICHRLAERWGAVGLPSVNLLNGEEVPDWVNTIRRCKILVTDSFHATCFGIIFRKPIIYLNIESRGGDRVPSMSRMLTVSIPIFSEEDLLNNTDDTLSRLAALKDAPMDYTAAEPVLAAQIDTARRFLQQALDAPMPPGSTVVHLDRAAVRAERRAYLAPLWKEFRKLLPQYIGHRIQGIFNRDKLAKSGREKRRLLLLWKMITY
ncbi:MAG: polysaccharide pyruvyl transferase family protein [Akkermansia muciniphila]